MPPSANSGLHAIFTPSVQRIAPAGKNFIIAPTLCNRNIGAFRACCQPSNNSH